jgi:hypothetical protein
MYGGEAFSQVAFASPPKSFVGTYSLNIFENVSLRRSYTAANISTFGGFAFGTAPIAGQLTSIVFTDNPYYLVSQTLYPNITENINLGDTPIVNFALLEDIKENIALVDTLDSNSAFVNVVSEDVNVADSSIPSKNIYYSIVEPWGQTPYSVSNISTFGGFAFSSVPIAGSLTNNGYLPNPSYVASKGVYPSISENSSIDDSSSQNSVVRQNITENLILNDSNAQQSAYQTNPIENINVNDILLIIRNSFLSVTENANIAEVDIITAQFANAIVESLASSDFSSQRSTFSNAITENMYLLADPIARGWIKINDNQITDWVLINNTQ